MVVLAFASGRCTNVAASNHQMNVSKSWCEYQMKHPTSCMRFSFEFYEIKLGTCQMFINSIIYVKRFSKFLKMLAWAILYPPIILIGMRPFLFEMQNWTNKEMQSCTSINRYFSHSFSCCACLCDFAWFMSPNKIPVPENLENREGYSSITPLSPRII